MEEIGMSEVKIYQN